MWPFYKRDWTWWNTFSCWAQLISNHWLNFHWETLALLTSFSWCLLILLRFTLPVMCCYTCPTSSQWPPWRRLFLLQILSGISQGWTNSEYGMRKQFWIFMNWHKFEILLKVLPVSFHRILKYLFFFGSCRLVLIFYSAFHQMNIINEFSSGGKKFLQFTVF